MILAYLATYKYNQFIKTNAAVTRITEYIIVIFIDIIKWFIGPLLPVVTRKIINE